MALEREWGMEEAHRRELVEFIRYAAMAPSTHNSQPWKFAITEDAIRIHPDYSRHLPVSDPYNRELFISLGCALEDLVIALESKGYGSRVELFPGDETEECLRVAFCDLKKRRDPALFEAIPERQTNRSKFDDRKIPNDVIEKLKAVPLEDGVSVHWIIDQAEKAAVIDLVVEADRVQLENELFRNELISWIRFNKSEAKLFGDGLSSESIGSPSGPRWLGSFFIKHLNLAEAKAEKDETFLESSPVIASLSTDRDNKKAWVSVGRTFERLVLTATSLGVQHAHMNQPIEVSMSRDALQATLGLVDVHPQLVIRLGYAAQVARSQRRSIEDILLETPDTMFERSWRASS